MAMEDKQRKENIQNQIQQKIAIANIKKEFAMQKEKNKKIIYGISSVCAVFVIGIGILFVQQMPTKGQQKHKDIVELGKGIQTEDLSIEWKINQLEEKEKAQTAGNQRADITTNTYPLEKWPEKSQFLKEVQFPEGYRQTDCYAFFTKHPDTKEYTIVHDYILLAEKGENQQIRIACSELGEPIRDYGLSKGEENTKIGEQEFNICKNDGRYFVTFQLNGLYWDIETTGVTEKELKDLLLSFASNREETMKIATEEGEDMTKEPINITDATSFPEYYAGRYVDQSGNQVILLCQDNAENRKEICKILGITESKTRFQTATYSYNYLQEVQTKISNKMVAKELPFVSTSALLEDKNRIRVTVYTSKESDLQKLRKLDTKGGAIQIEYQEGAQVKTELLQEKE